MARDDRLPLEGEVTDINHGIFMVQVKLNDRDHMVKARLSGKMRQNKIRVVVGDWVRVEVSPYDTSQGSITFRDKGGFSRGAAPQAP